MALFIIGIALILGTVNSENSTLSDISEDSCEPLDIGPWSLALEDWAVATTSGRHGKDTFIENFIIWFNIFISSISLIYYFRSLIFVIFTHFK